MPRLSLVHQLVLLLMAAVLLAVSALGGVVAWNLRKGFTDYLRQQDEAWVTQLAEALVAAVTRDGPDVLRLRPPQLVRLVEPDAPIEGPPPPAFQHDDGEAGPPRPPRPPPAPGGRYGPRLSVVAPDGTLLSGRPSRQPPAVERPVQVDGRILALVRLAPGPPPGGGLDAAFLSSQYRGILGAAIVLLCAAVAGAVFFGRRWLRPVQAAREAARQMAGGAFATRVVVLGNDELADLGRDLNAMAVSLGNLESSRRRWIAELSHEMRTPLAVLRAEIESLADGVRPLSMTAIHSLHCEVERLTRLTDDFHLLALSDLRALPCRPAPVDPATLLRDAAERVSGRAHAAGIAVHCDAGPTGRIALWDAQRIEQLLENLAGNSLQYTSAPGEMRFTLHELDADRLALTIEDSAPGVPDAELPRLFEPLYRTDSSRSRASGGSGLGLAICRAIVLSHGGDIDAGPSALGGLRVTAILPRRAAGTS
jgi:two-component system sensor histidine kinase BaeS